MYRNDELAQEIAPNGQTHIANSNNELINTINSLSGFINIMETSGYNITEPQMAEVTMQMHIDMKNIAIMFDTLLDMAYFDSYDKLPTNDHVSVNEMCQTMIADFIQRRKEDVEILFQSDLVDNFCVNTNYNALYKLLRYTLDNADKFTLKGTITVECKKVDNKTRIIFSDTGSGIAENEQEKVFQRFYRSECPYPGIGLGLPICRKIASIIGCTINLNKEYKNGCQFYIEWK
jgi:K+-sensing histidine kinase KdpD